MYANLLKHLIIAVVSVSTLFSLPTKLGKRSTTGDQFNGPCFVLQEEGPSQSTPFNGSIADLKARTAGLITDSHILKDFIKSHYDFHDSTAAYLDQLNWMGDEEFIASDEQKEAAITEPTEALKSHYLLLAENVLYIEQARTVGPIGEKKSEATTRQNLHDFELKLYSCMCSLKIALLSKGSDVNNTVTNDILNSNFLSYSSPLENATYRTYVTIQDSLELVQFLHEMYSEIELSLDDTEA